MDYKAAFLMHLGSEGIKYEDVDTYVVKVTYSGENMNTIPVFVFFDKDGANLVAFKLWNVGKFADAKTAAGLVVMNALNAKYRWVKFYLDDNSAGVAEMDAYVDEQTIGPECLELVRRMISIVDEAYPEIMKAQWS